MSQPLTVKDYMTRVVSTTTTETDIDQAIRVLVEEQIAGMPVLDGNGTLIGILTTRDCLKVAFSASYHRESGGRVSNYMSTNVQSVGANMDIVEMAELFVNSRYHQFPVVSEGRLVGLISRYDVLKALAELW